MQVAYQNINSWTNSLTTWINPYHELEDRISSIGKNELTEENKKDLNQAFALCQGWTWPAGRMKTLLSSVDLEIITTLIDDLQKSENEIEILERLPAYLSALTEDSLLQLSQLRTSEIASAVFDGQGLIKDFALKNSLEKEATVILKEFAIELKYFGYHILDMLTALTGINEIGTEKRGKFSARGEQISGWQAQNKIESYWKLIALPATIFAFIYTYIELQALAVGLTALFIIGALIAIVAYQRYFKPCPKEHGGLKNLTIEVLKKKKITYPMLDIIQQIETAFARKKGVILVAPPGSGKSSIARALAEQINEGKICASIKNAQLFACGATKFKSMEDSLSSIEETFKNHVENVIFFFDEFHSLFKKDAYMGANSADEVKLFCEEFKYVIGATTSDEYSELIENQKAIVDRRFVVIHMPTLTDEKIEIILSQFLQISNPEINIEKDALKFIIENSEKFNSNTAKIDAAQSLLDQAINKISFTEFTDLKKQIFELEDRIGLLSQKIKNATHCEVAQLNCEVAQLNTEIKEAKKELAQLQQDLSKKNQQVERIKKIETCYLKLKQQSYRTANPNITLESNPEVQRKWLELQTQIRILEELIAKQRKELSLPTSLSKELIQSLLDEGKKMKSKA
jgi:hypothetical protein